MKSRVALHSASADTHTHTRCAARKQAPSPSFPLCLTAPHTQSQSHGSKLNTLFRLSSQSTVNGVSVAVGLVWYPPGLDGVDRSATNLNASLNASNASAPAHSAGTPPPPSSSSTNVSADGFWQVR